MIITVISMALETIVYSLCDSTSISRIQRPLKACFCLLHYDDEDVEHSGLPSQHPVLLIDWLHTHSRCSNASVGPGAYVSRSRMFCRDISITNHHSRSRQS